MYTHHPDLLIVDIWCNLVLMGMVYAVAFLAGCMVAALLRPRALSDYFMHVKKLGLFLLILLAVGDLFGCLWGETIWGRFYLSTDYCNSDFIPFLPITQGQIDSTFADEPHGLLGVTLTQLHFIWFGFAVATWATTLVLYRLIARVLLRKQYPREGSVAVA